LRPCPGVDDVVGAALGHGQPMVPSRVVRSIGAVRITVAAIGGVALIYRARWTVEPGRTTDQEVTDASR
ncbi:MAG: hypothetical protein ACRDTJ_22180, partial [Pseudonocardiaceae bacterium]